MNIKNSAVLKNLADFTLFLDMQKLMQKFIRH